MSGRGSPPPPPWDDGPPQDPPDPRRQPPAQPYAWVMIANQGQGLAIATNEQDYQAFLNNNGGPSAVTAREAADRDQLSELIASLGMGQARTVDRELCPSLHMLSRRSSSPGGSGGPHAKRPRGVDVGEPVENEATARRKLEEAGFNPDNASEPATPRELEYGTTGRVTPMVHFSRMGDLPMCRYLFTQGAHESVFGRYVYTFGQRWCPMYAAANEGHLAICKWLHKMGAQEDVWRKDFHSQWCPLGLACCGGKTDVCRWLILNGALHRKGSFDSALAAIGLDPTVFDAEKRKAKKKTQADLLTWAQDMISLHSMFFSVFLMGTLSAPDKHSNDLQKLLSRKLGSAAAAGMIIGGTTTELQHSLWQELRPRQSPLCMFAGFPGILEIMADFAGVGRGRDLQIARDLVEFMTSQQFRGDDDYGWQ